MHMRFLSEQRIRAARDFARIREEGTSRNTGPFIVSLYRRAEGTDKPRFGVIASKRVGGAVLRFRAKRIFREIFRLNQDILPPKVDIVVIVRSGFERYSYEELTARYQKACKFLTSK